MTITIDRTDYNLPSEITLGERIEFSKIIDIEDIALRSVSFYGKIPIEVLERTSYEDALVIHNELTKQFSEDIDFTIEHEVQREFFWNNEMWEIPKPELKQDSKMLFGEFIDSKQSVQNAGEDIWTSLHSLCSIYFRKKGEAYDKSFPIEGPRSELMKTLPFSYAIEVGFFLSNL